MRDKLTKRKTVKTKWAVRVAPAGDTKVRRTQQNSLNEIFYRTLIAFTRFTALAPG